MIDLKDKTLEELEVMAKTARPFDDAQTLVKEICHRKYGMDEVETTSTDTPDFRQGDTVEIEKHDLNCLYEAIMSGNLDTENGFAYNTNGSYVGLRTVAKLLGREYPD